MEKVRRRHSNYIYPRLGCLRREHVLPAETYFLAALPALKLAAGIFFKHVCWFILTTRSVISKIFILITWNCRQPGARSWAGCLVSPCSWRPPRACEAHIDGVPAKEHRWGWDAAELGRVEFGTHRCVQSSVHRCTTGLRKVDYEDGIRPAQEQFTAGCSAKSICISTMMHVWQVTEWRDFFVLLASRVPPLSTPFP